MNITRTAVSYPTLTVIAMLILVLWGLSYFGTMSRRESPEITIRTARVITFFPGALPEDIEQYVTKPLEDVAASVAEVSEIQSTSKYSVSIIWVGLDPEIAEKDVPQVWDRLRAKIAAIKDTLPIGTSDPLVDDEFFDTNSHIIAISGENYTPRELHAFADRIKNRLSSLPDAGRVDTWAEQEERIYLEYDPAKLAQYGVHLNQIINNLQQTNKLSPGGEISAGGRRYAIEATGDFESLADIENLPVYGATGAQTALMRDLGEVSYGYEDPSNYIAHFNGIPCSFVSVVLRSGKNVVALGKQVQAELAEIRKSLPSDLDVTIIHDQPYQVGLTINSFLSNMYTAIFLVILVVFLFMGVRAAIPVGLAIPLVLVSSFAVLSVLGTTLQQMSIAGMIIALGMLVDNAIVVTDNISRFIDKGMSRREAAVKATNKLAIPMLTSTLTTVCAFLPLLMIGAETGDFIRDIPITVSVAILMSYLIAITVTPTICSYMIVSTTKHKPFQPLDPLMRLIERAYSPVLRWSQKYRVQSLIIVLVSYVGSLVLMGQLGVQFFPAMERDQFAIDMFLPDGASIQETKNTALYIENILANQDGIENYTTHIGQGGPSYHYNRIPVSLASNYAEFLVNTDSSETTKTLIPQLRKIFKSGVPGARVEVKKLEQGPPVGAPIQIKLQGENIAELKRLGAEVTAILETRPEMIDISDSCGEDSRQIKLNVNENQLRSVGLTRGDVHRLTALNTNGMIVTEYRAPGRTIPVVIRPYKENRDEALDVSNYYLQNLNTGDPVPLASVATVETVNVTSKIKRVDRVRELEVGGYMSGKALASDTMKVVWPLIQEIELPPGYEIKQSGEAEESGEAFSGLAAGLVIALLLIVLVLVAQFKSIRIAMVVFLAIPLSTIGAVLGLYITGWPFGFMAGLGIISLAGIVINSSIVLMDTINEKLREKHSIDEAIILAGESRMRPIMLTTATTVGGLLPLGLFGGGMWAPMTFAIIGGLIVSTGLTLVVVPLIFRLVAAKRAVELIEESMQTELADCCE